MKHTGQRNGACALRRRTRSNALPGWRLWPIALVLLSVTTTTARAHYTGEGSPWGQKRTLCYRLIGDIAKDAQWLKWVKQAIDRWNDKSRQTRWTFVECTDDDKNADFDFQFLTFAPDSRYQQQLNDRKDGKAPGNVTPAQTGPPGGTSNSTMSVKIVKDIDKFTVNGTTVSGGASGWDVADGQNKEKRQDPVLTIMHEMTHVMLLDHATNACSATDFEEPVCAGDHGNRPPSPSDINQIRFAHGVGIVLLPTVTPPDLPRKGCFDTQEQKTEYLADLQKQIDKIRPGLKQAQDELADDNKPGNAVKQGQPGFREWVEKTTLLEFRIQQDQANIDVLQERYEEAKGKDICGHGMRTAPPLRPSSATPPLSPAPSQNASTTGFYLGGELVKTWGHVDSTETLADTGIVTNRFSDMQDPLGVGVLIGYKFAPWSNSIVVSPFASFDYLNAPVNHTFPGGSFLGTTANFAGTAGVKIGPQLAMGLWLYGIAGASFLNETLNVNFVPTASSRTTDVSGATVGVGGAWQPRFLQGSHPMSLFVEYQHTWWRDANFNTPAASPFFNYTFRREDDFVKFGFTIPTSAPIHPVTR
jgi:hypothetical protein